MKTLLLILAAAIVGYLITGTLYLAAAHGGVMICTLAVYSLWKDERDRKHESALWARLTTREREDRLMMLIRMAKVEQAKQDMGIDYVLDPKYKLQERHRLTVDENK